MTGTYLSGYAASVTLPKSNAPANTTIALTVPSTVSTSKPLYLYWSNLSNAYLSTPPPVSWSAAIARSRSGNVATFSIPNFSIAAGSNSLVQVMQ